MAAPASFKVRSLATLKCPYGNRPWVDSASPTPFDDAKTPRRESRPQRCAQAQRGRGWAELFGMSGGGTETPVGCEAALGGGSGGKKKDSLGFAGSPAHLIIKDLGEIHSRLLDHRPVIQGETRYFVKEFEEKRGLREMRVLENLKNMIHETNEHTLPTCRATMQDSLNQVLQRLQAATDSVRRLQQREQERKKIHNDLLIASEKQHVTQWEDFMKEQHSKQAEVDEEHRKAVEKLREQYTEMEKGLARFSTF